MTQNIINSIFWIKTTSHKKTKLALRAKMTALHSQLAFEGKPAKQAKEVNICYGKMELMLPMTQPNKQHLTALVFGWVTALEQA
jgi:hypothetical protein